MPRVLRIINRFNLGGPTYNAAYLTRFMGESANQGDEIFETLLIGGSPIPGEAHSGYILESLGVKFTEISEMSRSIHPINDLRAFRHIRKIIREFKPDIVHTHAAKAGALGRLAAWMENVPVIVHTFHGHVLSKYFGALKSWLARTAERWLARRSTAIVNISQKMQEEIVHQLRICPIAKSHVIPLGFDLERFNTDQLHKRKQFRDQYQLQENEIAIGIIGRLASVKNHALFIESMKQVHASNKSVKTFIIGDGDMKNAFIKLASPLRVSETSAMNADVVFTSWIRQIDIALAGLDIVVLTSLNEGTPVSLIEAQAAAKPIVSTDVGGVRDCVQADLSGYIVAMDPQSIATKLETLAGDEALRKKMGEAGRAFVMSRYAYQRLVFDMRMLYMQLVANRKKNN